MDFYLAPINTLSNHAFRRLCLDYEADFVFTEMIWAERILEGMVYEKRKLLIDEEEKTIIQIIAKETKNIEPFIKILKKSFPKIKEINFNMGCPQSTLLVKKLGGGILKDKKKMSVFCKAFAKACEKHKVMPSVKTRIGVNTSEVEEYVKIIKDAGIKKIYIHARTLTQGYVKKADYSTLKNVSGIHLVINGDIIDTKSYDKAISSVKCEGVMIGREALKDPTIFLKLKNKKTPTKKEVMLKFLEYGANLPIDVVKKNVSWMTNGMIKGAEVRSLVNDAKKIENIKNIIEKSL